MEVGGRLRAVRRVLRDKRHGGLVAAGQPDRDVPVIVTAHTDDGRGADNVAAVGLGDPDIWCGHVRALPFRSVMRAAVPPGYADRA